VLHPDAHPTGADKDRAVKDWNAWKNDSDKVRRQGR
jgi:hypothetical protein